MFYQLEGCTLTGWNQELAQPATEQHRHESIGTTFYEE